MNAKKKMTKREAVEAILKFLAEQDADGAQNVYFGALVTDDDETTLRDALMRAIK